MEISALFRDSDLSSRDFPAILGRESTLVASLARLAPAMAHEHWFLKGDTLEEATLYPAFNADGSPSTPAIAVLSEAFRENKQGVSFAAIWNNSPAGGSMTCRISDAKVLPDRLAVRLGPPSCYATVDASADVVRAVIDTFAPRVVQLAPAGYAETQTFKDKPGAGWMLYLPTVISTQQVPEARALIPVPGPGKKQTGTIVVSVIDEIFSIDNPEHLEAAHAIETRLVDRDLLPRYTTI